MILDFIVILSHCHQSLMVVVEVGLDDIVFTLVDDALDPGDAFVWVEGVTFIEVVASSCLASQPIT